MLRALLGCCIVSLGAASDSVSRDEFLQLSSRLNELSSRLKAVEAENQSLRQLLESRNTDAAAPGVTAASVGSSGGAKEVGRRLQSAAASYVAVKSWQVHEFPDGHSCSNTGTQDGEYKDLLPVDDGSGKGTFQPSPTIPTADVSLNAVASDWALGEVQRMPAPLKVVHDATCSAEPSLHLPLDTVFEGTVTINGSTMVGGQASIIPPVQWHMSGATGYATLDTGWTTMGLTKTFTLDTRSICILSYAHTGIKNDPNAPYGSHFTVTRLVVDGVYDPQTIAITGIHYSTNHGLSFRELAAGTHTASLEYRSSFLDSWDNVDDWRQSSIQVLVLPKVF